MFENIVVGVDEHQGGRDAIFLAKETWPRGTPTSGSLTSTPHARARLGCPVQTAQTTTPGRELLAAARDEASIEAQLCCIASSSVGRGLHQLAEVKRADLVVVGSSRRGLLGRLLLGDDTRAALNGAPCAVAIAPAGYSQESAVIREIGVGYNGSPESRHALELAGRQASGHRAKLSAFEAVSLPAYLFSGGPAPVDLAIEDVVKNARERVAALDGVEPHAAYGNPAEELTLYSASLDLLVVGSRGYGPIGRLMHGSVSQQLARTARCPLLALTRAAHAEPTANGSKTPGQAAAAA